MVKHVSKSAFKARALAYFREVEETGDPIVITDRGRPVLRLERHREDPEEVLRSLRGTVLRYDDPTEPVEVEEWEALR